MKADRLLTALILGCCLLAGGVVLYPTVQGGEPKERADEFMPVTIPADDRTAVRVRRIDRKMVVVRRLLDGDLTLVEAGALFRDLNACPSGMEDVSWHDLPGADDGERQCRQVIAWARAEMVNACSPDELQTNMARLERELEEHVTAHNGVTLPEYAE
jgi:hypothetical protein